MNLAKLLNGFKFRRVDTFVFFWLSFCLFIYWDIQLEGRLDTLKYKHGIESNDLQLFQMQDKTIYGLRRLTKLEIKYYKLIAYF